MRSESFIESDKIRLERSWVIDMSCEKIRCDTEFNFMLTDLNEGVLIIRNMLIVTLEKKKKDRGSEQLKVV